MTDIAELGIRIDTRDLARANRDLGNASQEAGRTERATRTMGQSVSRAGQDVDRFGALAKTSFASTSREAGELVRNFQRIALTAAGVVGVGLSFESARRLASQAISEYVEMERTLGRIDGVLRATGNMAGVTTTEIYEMSAAIADATLASRRDMMAASAQLATFAGVTRDNFADVLELAQDLAEVYGQDLRSSIEAVGRALEDPITGFARLREQGFRLSAEQEALAVSFVRTGDRAAAAQIVIDSLSESVGGAGRGAARGLAGAADSARQAWEELMESIVGTSGTTGPAGQVLASLRFTLNAINAEVETLNQRSLAEIDAEIARLQNRAMSMQGFLGAIADVPILGSMATVGTQNELYQLERLFAARRRLLQAGGESEAAARAQTEAQFQAVADAIEESGRRVAAASAQFATPAERMAETRAAIAEEIAALERMRITAPPGSGGRIDELIAQYRELERRQIAALSAGTAAHEAMGQAAMWEADKQRALAQVLERVENIRAEAKDSERLEAERQIEQTLQRQERLRQVITGAAQLHVQHMSDLNALLASGAISVEQFAFHAREAESAFLNLRVDMGGATAFEGILAGLDAVAMRSHNTAAVMRDAFGGFFSELSQGSAQAFGQAIAYGDGLGATLQRVAAGAMANLIASVVQYGIEWVLARTIMGAAEQANQAAMLASATAVNGAIAAQGAAVAAAWAPAAAAVSLGTMGANSGFAMAGMAQTAALSEGLFGMGKGLMKSAKSALPGFNDGGSFTIGGHSGIDQNIMSINGNPVARVGRGEIVDIIPRHAAFERKGGTTSHTTIIDLRGALVTREVVEDLRRGLGRVNERVEMVDQSIPGRVMETLVGNRELSGSYVG